MAGINYTDKEANEKGLFFRINGRSCKIMSYKGEEEHVVIPDTINGKPVRAIGKRAFAGKGIKKISLPDSLRSIKEEAFRESSLTEVELPAGIEKIEKSAFENCKELRYVTIEGNKNKKNLMICDRAFYGTIYSESAMFVMLGDILVAINPWIYDGIIRIPEGVRVIGCSAMADSWEVKRIEIPETVERIDDRAFAGAYLCQVVALNKPQNYIKMGEDVFGKVSYFGNNFSCRLVRQELVSSNNEKGGWKIFENFSINLGQMHIWKVTLYVPVSNPYRFWEELKVTYLYDFRKGRKAIPYMEGHTYYKLFKECDAVKDKIQMAECMLMNYMGGYEARKEALWYLAEHINRAIEFAIVHNKKDTLVLYEKHGLLKEKGSIENTNNPRDRWNLIYDGQVNIKLRHVIHLMKEYDNEAAEYLEKFL